MAEIQGVAHNVRVEQEGGSVILRFVLDTESERIPVEMRGVKVLGVLDNDDRVRLTVRGSQVRGRDGVARPSTLTNLSTHSVVRVARRGCLRTLVSFAFSMALSVVTGALSTMLITSLFGGGEVMAPVAYSLEEGPEVVAEEPFLAIPLLIGIAIAAVVFFFVFVRPRLHRD